MEYLIPQYVVYYFIIQALRHRPRISDAKLRNNRHELPPSDSTDSTVMQEFSVSSISGADSIVAKSTIMLPVYNKVTEKISANFTLIPSI